VDPDGSTAEALDRPRLLELFITFAQVSSLTIGGGYVMFPLLTRYVVDKKRWSSAEELVDYYALGQSVPGIIAINTATLIGYRKRGLPGAVAAAAGMSAPSLAVILMIAAFLTPYFDTPWVQKAFAGVRAAVVGMLVMAVWQVGRKAVHSWAKGALALASCVAILFLNSSPVLLIVIGGLLGMLFFRTEGRA
jgi:chromate transporter